MVGITKQAPPEKPDITVTQRILERRIPITVLRVGIAILSSLIGSVGWVFVLNHQGRISSDGISIKFGLAAVIAMAIGVLLAVGPMFKKRPWLRHVFVAALVIAVVASSVRNVRDAIIFFCSLVAMILIVDGLKRCARRASTLVGRRLRTRGLHTAAGVLVLAIALSMQVGAATTALAQEATPTACDSSEVSARFASRPLDLTSASVGDAPAQVTIDLDRGDANYSFVAESTAPTPIILTVELVKTAPLNVVSGDGELLWHERIATDSSFTGLLRFASDRKLDTFTIAVDGTTSEIPAFAGTATIRISITDEEGGERCQAEVRVKVIGSPWQTLLGLAATCALALGGAGVASSTLSGTPPNLPAAAVADGQISAPGTMSWVGDTPRFEMGLNERYQIRLDLQFPGIKADDDELERLKKLGIEAVTIREIPSIVDLDIGKTFELPDAIGALAHVVAVRVGVGTLTLDVAGHPIEALIEVAEPPNETPEEAS